MANIGIGAGLAGFAEGFAKSFTRRKEIEAEEKNKRENFINEQLLKGAMDKPQAVRDSAEIQDLFRKQFGDQGDVVVQFLTKYANDVDADSAEAFLTAPAPGQASQAAPAAASSPESQMITGQGTVLAPPAEATAPTAQMIAPSAAPQAAPTRAAAPAVFTDAQGQSWDAQGNPVEAVPMVEEPAAKIPAPAKSRAQQIQERLPAGVEFTRKFPGGRTVKLVGGKQAEAQGFQTWFDVQAQNPNLTPQEAAMNTVEIMTQRGIQPPKALQELALTPITAQSAAQAAALKEQHLREVGFKFPTNEQEFRGSIAKGLFPGSYVVGRDLKDVEINAAKTQNLVIQTMPDGTRIAVPRGVAQLNSYPTTTPEDLINEAEIQKFKAKSGQAKQAANAFLKILDRAKPGYELLLPGPKSFAGAAFDYLKARTTLQAKLFTLRRQGNGAAKGLAGLSSGATPYVKAFFEVGAITKDDRKGYEDIAGNIARGYASRPEAEAADAWMRAIIQELHTVGDPKKARENVGGLNDWVSQAEAAAEAGASTPPSSATAQTAPSTTTSTTLPFNAQVFP